MRRCGRCCETLPLDAFNRAGDGHQHWCRECFRAYHRARRKLHLEQLDRSIERRRDHARRLLAGYLATHPCVDCGEPDTGVLEFDHIGEKRDEVANLVRRGAAPDRLWEEIAKCEVACVNCHRRRTARRGRFMRHELSISKLMRMKPLVRRNVLWLIDVLRSSSCLDCGERDIVVLDFDHVGSKRESVTRLAVSGYSIESLQAEISRCEIRCANCHRRRTAAMRGWYRHVA